MNRKSLLAVVSLPLLLLTTTPAPAQERLDELGRLQLEYGRRRAEAIRLVMEGYRRELLALREKLGAESEAVAAELRKVDEKMTAKGERELKRAIVSSRWIWQSDLDGDGVVLTFTMDGKVRHHEMHGDWKVSGPSQITIQAEGDGAFVLRFDPELRKFSGDREGVRGERLRGEEER